MVTYSAKQTREIMEFKLNELLDKGVDIVGLENQPNCTGLDEIVAIDIYGGRYRIITSTLKYQFNVREANKIINEFNSGVYIDKYLKKKHIEQTKNNIRDGVRRYNNLIDRNF